MPGPVSTIVFVPDRQSGIPTDVEQPAPVKKIACFEFVIASARVFTLLLINYSLSIHYLTEDNRNSLTPEILILLIIITYYSSKSSLDILSIQKMTQLFNKATADMNNAKFKQAINKLNNWIAAGSSTEDAFRMRAQAHFYLHQFSSAANSYEDMIKRYPSQQDGYSGKALALTIMGQHSQASKLLKTAFMLNSSNWKSYFCKGYQCLKSRKYEQSLQALQQAITKNSRNDPLSYICRAAAFCNRNNFQNSRKDIKYAITAVMDQENHKLLYSFQIPYLQQILADYQQRISQLDQMQASKRIKPKQKNLLETDLTLNLSKSAVLYDPTFYDGSTQKIIKIGQNKQSLTDNDIVLEGEQKTPLCSCKGCAIF